MRLRKLIQDDVIEIDRIWRTFHRHDFGVPNPRNKVIDAVAENDQGRIIAYGQVKHIAEAVFILDNDARPRDKILALRALMLEALRGTDQAGITQLYAFIKNPMFADLIEKHFGFERADTGEFLIREV